MPPLSDPLSSFYQRCHKVPFYLSLELDHLGLTTIVHSNILLFCPYFYWALPCLVGEGAGWTPHSPLWRDIHFNFCAVRTHSTIPCTMSVFLHLLSTNIAKLQLKDLHMGEVFCFFVFSVFCFNFFYKAYHKIVLKLTYD